MTWFALLQVVPAPVECAPDPCEVYLLGGDVFTKLHSLIPLVATVLVIFALTCGVLVGRALGGE